VEATAAATRSAASASPAFDVVLGSAGAFPSGKRPRALWVDVLEGVDELAAVAGRLDGELRDRGWSFDDRPFRAHLTLARADGIRAGATVAARLIEAARDLELRFTADRIVLFESHTGGGPARYEPVAVASLAGGHPPQEA
jgi:2'-5' RNA ligase